MPEANSEGAIGQNPLGLNSKVHGICPLHGMDIGILKAKMIVLVLQFVVTILLCVFLQSLD